MRTYDLHQHLLPEPFLSVLSRRREAPRLVGRRLELSGEPGGELDPAVHSLDARLSLLDRCGIERAVVSLAPTMETEPHDDLREAYHEGMVELIRASGGRLLALAAGERRAGFAGVCVSARALLAGADLLLAELESAGELLFVHPGPPEALPAGAPGWWPAVADYTAQMQAAYLTWLYRDSGRFTRLPIVFAILAGGAPIQLERLGSRGVDERGAAGLAVFFDTSSYGRRALDLCLSAFGSGRLVFGSDAPVIDPERTLAAVRSLGEAIEEIVVRKNPERLLRSAGPGAVRPDA